MRVLLVTGSLPPMKCGIGDYTEFLAEALATREGITVAVLTDVQAAVGGIHRRFEVFPVVDGWTFSDIPRIVRTILNWHPDIVHFQYPTQGYGNKIFPWLLPPIIGLLNVFIVQTWHEYYPLKGLITVPNAMCPGGLIVVRPEYKNRMPAWFRWLIRNKVFRFIPNASTIPVVQLTDAERAEIRSHLLEESKLLIIYFGFVYPAKGVEFLFEIADPKQHHLVLICELNPSDSYHTLILNHIRNKPWERNVTIMGFLSAEEVGRLLASADAVVFPFRDGGGSWNTSVHAAVEQGTFVLITSREHHGYDPKENIYYACPGDIEEMRKALHTYSGRMRKRTSTAPALAWDAIADSHIQLYRDLQGPISLP